MTEYYKNEVTIFADGACEPNPGIGGWGSVLMCGKHTKEISGVEPVSTNNKMELTAVIRALQCLKGPSVVKIHIDSKYVKDGITQWIHNWKKNNWVSSSGKSVANQDLWKILDSLVTQHQIEWFWVKGHAGHIFNEKCDELATSAIAEYRRGNRI